MTYTIVLLSTAVYHRHAYTYRSRECDFSYFHRPPAHAADSARHRRRARIAGLQRSRLSSASDDRRRTNARARLKTTSSARTWMVRTLLAAVIPFALHLCGGGGTDAAGRHIDDILVINPHTLVNWSSLPASRTLLTGNGCYSLVFVQLDSRNTGL
eukprot:SAG31_NODE_26_length_32985_cov_39.054096_10_plen_156_part_00